MTCHGDFEFAIPQERSFRCTLVVSQADGVRGRVGTADLQDAANGSTAVNRSARRSGGPGAQGGDTARDVAELVLAVRQGGMITTPNRDAEVYERRIQAFIDSVVTD